MADSVNRGYLDASVSARDSEPHAVYVTSPGDPFRSTLLPLLEESADMAGQGIRVVVVDLAEDADNEFGGIHEFCREHQILAFPTILVFRRGNLQASFAGFVPQSELVRQLRRFTESSDQVTPAEKLIRINTAIQQGGSVESVRQILEE